MTVPQIARAKTHVLRYEVGDAARDLFVGEDDDGQVRVWGEISEEKGTTKVDLCKVFLEYALHCANTHSRDTAAEQVALFGQQIGMQLAEYLKRNPELVKTKNVALGALECLFGNIRASYFEDYAASGVRFVVTECPLEEAAKRSGLEDVELARHGVNSMCQSLCQGMSPEAVVKALPDSRPDFAFTITLPAAA
jgi:hypothetical protein